MRAHVVLWRALAQQGKSLSQPFSLSTAGCRDFGGSAVLQADSSAEGPPKQKLSALPFRVLPSGFTVEGYACQCNVRC